MKRTHKSKLTQNHFQFICLYKWPFQIGFYCFSFGNSTSCVSLSVCVHAAVSVALTVVVNLLSYSTQNMIINLPSKEIWREQSCALNEIYVSGWEIDMRERMAFAWTKRQPTTPNKTQSSWNCFVVFSFLRKIVHINFRKCSQLKRGAARMNMASFKTDRNEIELTWIVFMVHNAQCTWWRPFFPHSFRSIFRNERECLAIRDATWSINENVANMKPPCV